MAEVQIDEKWFQEWFQHGWGLLISYLTLHARFDQWCLEHPTPEDSCEHRPVS